MMLMGLGMLFFWGLLIVLAVFLVRSLFSSHPTPSGSTGTPVISPKEILKQRYARGEINQEQFRLMLKDLDETGYVH
jgi:putative membrane protein